MRAARSLGAHDCGNCLSTQCQLGHVAAITSLTFRHDACVGEIDVDPKPEGMKLNNCVGS
jgi:hypothetical protein